MSFIVFLFCKAGAVSGDLARWDLLYQEDKVMRLSVFASYVLRVCWLFRSCREQLLSVEI